MKVSELIGSRKEVFSITEETSVHQAAQYLREKQVRSVGVVDGSSKVVGVISHSDVSDKVAAENKCPAWMKASDIMTRELITVTPEMTLEDCLRDIVSVSTFTLRCVALERLGGGQREVAPQRLARFGRHDRPRRAPPQGPHEYSGHSSG